MSELLHLVEAFVAGAVISAVVVFLVLKNNQKVLANANAALSAALAALKKV